MRGLKLGTVFVLAVLLLGAGGYASRSAVTVGPQTVALSIPEATPMCDTTYTLDDADPNESTETVQVYWRGIELMRQGLGLMPKSGSQRLYHAIRTVVIYTRDWPRCSGTWRSMVPRTLLPWNMLPKKWCRL